MREGTVASTEAPPPPLPEIMANSLYMYREMGTPRWRLGEWGSLGWGYGPQDADTICIQDLNVRTVPEESRS